MLDKYKKIRQEEPKLVLDKAKRKEIVSYYLGKLDYEPKNKERIKENAKWSNEFSAMCELFPELKIIE